ncbi:plexin-C1-like isoform X2 [Gouania willdenowi]|uniref:plexin-C1-like isoform X2 n=1 Tax=Gouania willdenowi TaxID=441366 RepID=UPI001055A23B|nr:plexin-C1-like isoform X2 [Gouania willdenowi]
MILLLALLFVPRAAQGRCQEEESCFHLDGEIRQLSVANHSVYIATEKKLYQLNHELTLVHSTSQRGTMRPGKESDTELFDRVSGSAWWNDTFRINVFLPFVENKTLISCGEISGCGYCEILDLRNISNIIYHEQIQVGPLNSSSGSVAFLVTLKKTDTFILTAIQQGYQNKQRESRKGKDGSDLETVNLLDVDDSHGSNRGIFSLNDVPYEPRIKSNGKVEFVDGFQVGSNIYLLSNVQPSTYKNNKVRLIWFEDKDSKTETLKSVRGVTLSIPDGGEGSRLLASSIIPGEEPLLWSGVFSVDGGHTHTVLVLFDISPDHSIMTNKDQDFCYGEKNQSSTTTKILKPMKELLRQSYMTSVLALRHKDWRVFFIGTGDGQLIKLVVDRNFHPACPRVLYRANDDQRVFPRIHLDQVDGKHVYLPFTEQVKRVPVSQCSTHTNVQQCWSAQDPDCVWCGPKRSCMFESDCEDGDWVSIPDVYQQKMISHKVVADLTGRLTLNIHIHVSTGQNRTKFTCQVSGATGELCSRTGPPSQFPQCICLLSDITFPSDGLDVTVKMRVGASYLTERLKLTNCSDISGSPTSLLCQQCVSAGCEWSHDGCSWANNKGDTSVCEMLGSSFAIPIISSITPSVVSFHGRNHANLSGQNLTDVTAIRFQANMVCSPQEAPVWNNTGTSLLFNIPSTDKKGVITVCALLHDGTCHGKMDITYQSSPSCNQLLPNQSWISGNRKILLTGSHLEFVEGVVHSHNLQEVQLPRNASPQNLTYDTPAVKHNLGISTSSVFLKVANQTLRCNLEMTYYPDPEFTSFSSVTTGNDVRITIQKKTDQLEIKPSEVTVWGVQGEKQYPCIMENNENDETDLFICYIQSTSKAEFHSIMVKFGGRTVTLEQQSAALIFLVLLVLLLIPLIIVVVIFVYRSKQKKLNAQMNKVVEDLELDIRNDIRQGFVDLQTEKTELLENVGTIPFLDYKHFASRIFFPESESLMAMCVKDMGQDVVKVELDKSCQGLSKLIQDQVFLTSMVNALEEQKSFTIKDKCALASLLTVALHSNLLYLTEVMVVLLKVLMQKNSNMQPKLLLRRTESTVEKLLTNWMSICLYGFVREHVGQHLFLMVSAISQQICKGPVDCVTEKALYTLSEDWLLWQAPDFSSLRLKVLFAVGTDGGVSEPLEVGVLSCDTVEQVKEKILSTFKSKFGFPFSTSPRDACIEYEKNGTFIPLEEVDASSEVIGEVTMLNTLKHYKVGDGETVKVVSKKGHPTVSPQGSVKDDENFSGKYFHLIDPEVDENQRKNPERKKLKVKEVHLTKLLSTKVAVHSFVENLFRAIWGLSDCKAPHAVKYFFDLLDNQADNMKISDPDVLHIWKTNSLPLRFWVNILKNPQFVFDMEKSPHLDGCLSVIAQAFMDCFSLSETQLGKYAPTNKLLYAKEIPKFKQEVKAYYKQIKDQASITDSQLKEFLTIESKHHENEFNEAAALRELYKYIQRYYKQIKEKLEQNGVPVELTEQLQHVKNSFDGQKSCSWD